MAKAYGEVLRGIRNGSCSTYCATGAELIHPRFTDDWDILRCRECGGQSRLGILVHAPPPAATDTSERSQSGSAPTSPDSHSKCSLLNQVAALQVKRY
ncbi:hypothetical protein ABT007_27660 [Streptomyces griseus]|uniref:hypothetical protein n=1 Tax=Streptomyces griseus TaxID=1911 RepID=UPI00332DDD1B